MIILPNVLAPSTPHDALPGEITDYIIDFLHCDINSLKACAMMRSTGRCVVDEKAREERVRRT